MTPGASDPIDADSFDPAHKERVIAWLSRMARPAEERRYLYARWARIAGVPITTEDVQRVTANANS